MDRRDRRILRYLLSGKNHSRRVSSEDGAHDELRREAQGIEYCVRPVRSSGAETG